MAEGNKTVRILRKYNSERDEKYVEIPDNITVIGEKAFFWSDVEKIYLPEGITEIENGAFTHCKNLKFINIPSTVTKIGDEAFYNCQSLQTIILPDNINYIGNRAFVNCKNLTNVRITPLARQKAPHSPGKKVNGKVVISVFDSVMLGESIFAGCVNLKLAELPKDILEIPAETFFNCRSLQKVNIDSNAISISDHAFYNCINLLRIKIPSSVISIHTGAFEGCISLSEVRIGNQIQSIGDNAFTNCAVLKSINTSYKEGIVNFGDNLESIGENVFSGCSKIEKVYLGKKVFIISASAFIECENLQGVYIDELNPHCRSIDGVVFSKDKKIIQMFFNNRKMKSYCLPEETEEIASYAFYSSDVKKVVMGDNVKIIGDFAFGECTGLESIYISKNVKEIGKNAFQNCKSLMEINLSDSIEKIGSEAFAECKSIEKIVLPEKIQKIEYRTFAKCEGLFTISFPQGLKCVGSRAFEDCTNLREAVFHSNLTSAEDEIFRNCKSLKRVIFLSLLLFGFNSLYGCSLLEELEIGGFHFLVTDELRKYIFKVDFNSFLKTIGNTRLHYDTNIPYGVKTVLIACIYLKKRNSSFERYILADEKSFFMSLIENNCYDILYEFINNTSVFLKDYDTVLKITEFAIKSYHDEKCIFDVQNLFINYKNTFFPFSDSNGYDELYL